MTPDATEWSFERLLRPSAVEDFLTNRWGQEPLHIKRDESGYFEGALDLEQIERYLSREQFFQRNPVRVRTPEPPYEQDLDTIDAVYEHLSRGHTVQLLSAQSWLAPDHPVLLMARDTEQRLQHRIATIAIFVSPPEQQGLAVHHDQTEIITLQISGSKVWNLYGQVAPDIMPDKPHTPSEPPRLSAPVSAGDTLYVPRGLVHRVISQGEPSLSVAISFQSFAWSALISLIYEKATEDHALSESIPARALERLTEEEISSRLKRLTNLVSKLSPEDVRTFLRANRYSLPASEPESHLGSTFSPARVTADSIVRRRRGVAARVELQDDGAVIRATGLLPLRVPAKAAEAARALIEAEQPIRVRDLPSRLSAEAKGNLARRMLRLGLIVTETD